MVDETALAADLLAMHNQALSHDHGQQAQLLEQAHQLHSLSLPQTPVTTTATFANTTYPQATVNNATAAASAEPSSEPVQAYAKLEGDSFCYYIRTLQVTFGRKASSSDQVDIHLGPTKAISRQHARLFYNFTTQRFEMMVFGKNGAFVNDQFVEKGVTVPLENRTKIQIGEVSFSFLLPKLEAEESTQEAAYAQGTSPRGNGTTISSGTQGTMDSTASSSHTAIKRETSSQPVEQFDASEYSSRDTKPPFSYASLIAQAINSTPSRKLTLNGIYQHITNHYPYYQLAQNGWQNSIRHNLSLNKAFVKVPRSDSEPGKGAFWTIDQSCENQFANGVYKRNRRAMSSKPGGTRNRSDSESPYDQADKPKKRANTGTDATAPANSSAMQLDPTTQSQSATVTQLLTAQSSQLQTSAQQTQQQKQPATQTQATAPSATSVSNVGAGTSSSTQPILGLSALNLATLTQSITAAAKEGNQAALASALIAAANASGIPGGLAASLPATARALAAHLQQQQQLQLQAQRQQQQQQQQQQQSSSTSTATTPQNSVAPQSTASLSTQLLSALQPSAASASVKAPVHASSIPQPTASSGSSTSVSAIPAPSSSIQGSAALSSTTPVPSTTLASTPNSAQLSSLGSPSPQPQAASISSTASSSVSPLVAKAEPDVTKTQQSPIAQLVAAAQAQARAQAQAQTQAPPAALQTIAQSQPQSAVPQTSTPAVSVQPQAQAQAVGQTQEKPVVPTLGPSTPELPFQKQAPSSQAPPIADAGSESATKTGTDVAAGTIDLVPAPSPSGASST